MLTPPSNPKCPSCGNHLPLQLSQEQFVLIPRDQFDALFAMVRGSSDRRGESDATDPRLLQIVEFEAKHAYLDAGDRVRLAEEKLGLPRSTYYSHRKRAIDLGLMSLRHAKTKW